MRIRDWSSDVCSSDLLFVQGHEARHCGSVCHQQRIINAFHTGALSGPADDFAVKFHSRGGVCRYQFVPDEPALHVSHHPASSSAHFPSHIIRGPPSEASVILKILYVSGEESKPP